MKQMDGVQLTDRSSSGLRRNDYVAQSFARST